MILPMLLIFLLLLSMLLFVSILIILVEVATKFDFILVIQVKFRGNTMNLFIFEAHLLRWLHMHTNDAAIAIFLSILTRKWNSSCRCWEATIILEFDSILSLAIAYIILIEIIIEIVARILGIWYFLVVSWRARGVLLIINLTCCRWRNAKVHVLVILSMHLLDLFLRIASIWWLEVVILVFH